jgi:hypothetical protein
MSYTTAELKARARTFRTFCKQAKVHYKAEIETLNTDLKGRGLGKYLVCA